MPPIHSEEFPYTCQGAAVPARLYQNADGQKGPGVLLCPGRFRDINGLEFLSQALAQAGYVVLATTYRGMDVFTDDADIRAGLDCLAERPEVDAGRLALVGHSRGGAAALRTAADDERVRAVVALAPPIDFVSYMRAMELLSPMRYNGLLQSMGGTPEQQPERYRHISAINYADRIKVPVLFVVGTQDLHAPLDHSKWMHDALLKAGNPNSKLVALDGVGHFFERMYFGYEFDKAAEVTVTWLNETLPT